VSSKPAYADFKESSLKQLFFLKKYGPIFQGRDTRPGWHFVWPMPVLSMEEECFGLDRLQRMAKRIG